MPKILLVKTSSLGDVIHELPAVTDIRANFPSAELDWVVEENFAEIPALHPGVSSVIPVAIRRWRRALLKPSTWKEMGAFRQGLRARRYDLVLDSQGLLKSAIVTLLAHGPSCGYDRASAREALAALAYDRTVSVPKTLHAVNRNRLLAGRALGYEPAGAVDYGIAAGHETMPWLAGQPYVVLLHATSRADKEWPEQDWLALAAEINRPGLACVLPWASERERERSERLASQMRQAIVPPRLRLADAAALLGGARAVIGVDTGLSHLAAALKAPVLALYCASDPGLTGVLSGGPAVNLGRAGQPPRPDEVIAALERIMRT